MFPARLKWMMTFQCRDGGWAAFDKVARRTSWKRSRSPTTTPCSTPNGRHHRRAFWNCSATKLEHKPSQIRDALVYLREQPGRGWFLVWPLGVNYIYGTWQVLRGLRAITLTCNNRAAQGARLAGKRPAQGRRLGERCNTYDDPVFKGRGPSTASQTAWAVMGLCAFGDPDNSRSNVASSI